MLIALLTMTLFSMMAFATDREEGKGTDTLPGSGLMSDAESILDGVESDLMGTDSGKVTDRVTDTGAASGTDTGSGTGTGMAGAEDGGGVGLVIGIGVAVVALIIVFVILSRSSGTKK